MTALTWNMFLSGIGKPERLSYVAKTSFSHPWLQFFVRCVFRCSLKKKENTHINRYRDSTDEGSPSRSSGLHYPQVRPSRLVQRWVSVRWADWSGSRPQAANECDAQRSASRRTLRHSSGSWHSSHKLDVCSGSQSCGHSVRKSQRLACLGTLLGRHWWTPVAIHSKGCSGRQLGTSWLWNSWAKSSDAPAGRSTGWSDLRNGARTGFNHPVCSPRAWPNSNNFDTSWT